MLVTVHFHACRVAISRRSSEPLRLAAEAIAEHFKDLTALLRNGEEFNAGDVQGHRGTR